MKGSRITAAGLVIAAGLWVFSGHLFPHEDGASRAAVRPDETDQTKLFRVAVMQTKVEPHRRRLVLSGRTEADRKVIATARSNGVVAKLNVRRGSVVKEGDVIAVLTDEAREAQVEQARALLAQRKTELEARAKLVAQGSLPRLEMGNLEAQYKAAEAALAAAEAERDRSKVLAPWSGIVNDVPAELGQVMAPGKEVAQIIALDPMLAVVEVAERKLAGVKVGDPAEIRLITGQKAQGRIRFVSKTASETTRTYRVDVEVPNPDGAIPDGITTEVALTLAAVPSTRVPRSALTFSSGGELGVRVVDGESTVRFVPVEVVEDEQQLMWVRGIEDGARVIVQGQDFVREGQRVEAVPAPEQSAAAQ
jgi:multidrug efflux system membrane fusion protein